MSRLMFALSVMLGSTLAAGSEYDPVLSPAFFEYFSKAKDLTLKRLEAYVQKYPSQQFATIQYLSGLPGDVVTPAQRNKLVAYISEVKPSSASFLMSQSMSSPSVLLENRSRSIAHESQSAVPESRSVRDTDERSAAPTWTYRFHRGVVISRHFANDSFLTYRPIQQRLEYKLLWD